MEEVGTGLSEIGLPEIDGVLQASVFGKHTTNDPVTEEIVVVHPRGFHKHLDMAPPKQCSRRPQQTNLYSTAPCLDGKSANHINRLPDDILQFIVSQLQMKEGTATAILSRQWRNIWASATSVLNFDLTNKIGYDYLADPASLTPVLTDNTFLTEERCKFTKWINQVLQLHHASSKINALRISFVLGEESASDIDRWIAYAANKGLTELDLDFNLLFFGYSSLVSYRFPFHLFTSSLSYLCLKCVCFYLPPDFKVFNSLKSLKLAYCFLNEDSVQNILSNCSSLECFSLVYCRFHESINKLEFSGPFLRLKHLSLFRFIIGESDIKIELHDVGIISFEYNDRHTTKLSIKNAPHLSRLVLCTKKPVDILGDVPHVQILFLATWAKVKASILPNLHVFNNLKRLVFIVNDDKANLLQVIYILEKCHSLQKLELDMGLLLCERNVHLTEIATRPGRPYRNLWEVEIYGFQDHLEKIELVKYVLKNAVALKRIKLSRTSRKYLGSGEWILYEGTAKKRRSLWNIWNQLQEEVSSSTTKTVRVK